MDENLYYNLYHAFHARCFDLTGDVWCPYPNEGFMNAVMKAPDDIARGFIEKRRTFSFPHFMMNEPMYEEIKEYL